MSKLIIKKKKNMGLNKQKGNMYEFVTHTFNMIKGQCYHDCSYCYMKHWKNLREVRFDDKELRTDLGKGNFIFVGSSCDMFAQNINPEWIIQTINHCKGFKNNYLFQSKDTCNLLKYAEQMPKKSVVCTTIETNRVFSDYMGMSPTPAERAKYLSKFNLPKYVTIEPIMDFDLKSLVELIKKCEPIQVNIGGDSCGHHLPEPSKDKILRLIDKLNYFTKVENKRNLSRIFKTTK
jgi:DNA repair photolyase